jgi:transcriptional regulator with XRE-family HTH domain
MSPKHPHASDLRDRLKATRVARQHGLRDAGLIMGVSHTVVAKWEEGTTVPPLRLLAGVARYLAIGNEEAIALRDAADAEPPRMTAMNRRRR